MKKFKNFWASVAVAFTYKKQQENKDIETITELDQLQHLSSAWQHDKIAKKQETVVDMQLKNLRDGSLDVVFGSLIETLKELDLEKCTLLDAACASGYYAKVIQSELDIKIKYTGADYSEAMINLAKKKFPEHNYSVQDLTNLSFEKRAFETVLVSGVLEHIPQFEKAIFEAARTASKYVILHRCLVSGQDENIYSTGFLYNIKTPRIYFSQKVLEEEFASHGFELIKKVKSHAYQGLVNRIRLFIKKYLLQRRAGEEYTFTFQIQR